MVTMASVAVALLWPPTVPLCTHHLSEIKKGLDRERVTSGRKEGQWRILGVGQPLPVLAHVRTHMPSAQMKADKEDGSSLSLSLSLSWQSIMPRAKRWTSEYSSPVSTEPKCFLSTNPQTGWQEAIK